MKNQREQRAPAEGSVLIVSLWVMIILSALSIAAAAHVSANLSAARLLRGRLSATMLARAGAAHAVQHLYADTNAWDHFDEPWHHNIPVMKEVKLSQGSFTIYHTLEASDGVTVTNFGLADEERKVNVNAATNRAGYALLRSIAMGHGELAEKPADALADAVADWIDADDEPREQGAEDAYYGALSAPYSCHNGRLGSIEELLLVRGMTEALFLKLRDHLTVHGWPTGAVNLNTAGPVVLRALVSAQQGQEDETRERDEIVNTIMEFREDGGVFDSGDKKQIRRALYGNRGPTEDQRPSWRLLEWAINHRLVTVQSRHFYAISNGRSSDSTAYERRIAFVCDRKEARFRAWYED